MDLGVKCKSKNLANIRGKQSAANPGMGSKTYSREALGAQLPRRGEVPARQRLPALGTRA